MPDYELISAQGQTTVNKYSQAEHRLDTERQIQNIYGIQEADCEKMEAVETMAARTLENTVGHHSAYSWRDEELRDFRASVDILSGGTNTVLTDDWGIPSVMVRFPMLTNSQLLQKGSDNVHPAFMLRGEPQEALYVSKFQNILIGGRGYSLPLKDPACGVTFDRALEACSTKGNGWHLSSFALRAALALWMQKNDLLPHGNSNSGCDYFHREEKGIPTLDGRVATGSGPVTWTHNRHWDGIFDLTGNLNEWDAGLRLMDGEIQIIPGNDCALSGCDMSQNSRDWLAILPNGALTDPGSPDTLKYDFSDGSIRLATRVGEPSDEPRSCNFNDIRSEEGLKVPELLYSLLLFPENPQGVYDGWRWIKTKGECFPLSGGAHRALNHAGVFFTGLTYPRTKDYDLVGFRSACIVKNEPASGTPCQTQP